MLLNIVGSIRKNPGCMKPFCTEVLQVEHGVASTDASVAGGRAVNQSCKMLIYCWRKWRSSRQQQADIRRTDLLWPLLQLLTLQIQWMYYWLFCRFLFLFFPFFFGPNTRQEMTAFRTCFILLECWCLHFSVNEETRGLYLLKPMWFFCKRAWKMSSH